MKLKEATTLEIITVAKPSLDRAVANRGGPTLIQPRCHPKSVCKAFYENGALKLSCWQCGGYMMDILLAEDEDFQISACDLHPEHYSAVIVGYDGSRLNIRCGMQGCKEVLHQLQVREE